MCKKNEVYDAGICYENKKCPCDGERVGPLCWDRCKPGTSSCGAICLDNKQSCTAKIIEVGLNVMIKIGVAAVSAVAKSYKTSVKVVADMSDFK